MSNEQQWKSWAGQRNEHLTEEVARLRTENHVLRGENATLYATAATAGWWVAIAFGAGVLMGRLLWG